MDYRIATGVSEEKHTFSETMSITTKGLIHTNISTEVTDIRNILLKVVKKMVTRLNRKEE